MREYVLVAWEQIKLARLAGLPRAHYCTARDLLDCVGADGELHLSDIAALAMCGINAIGTLRAHLIALQTADILQYTMADHQVHIGFLAWPAIAARAEARENRRDSRENRRDSREFRRDFSDFSTPSAAPEPESELTRAEIGEIRANLGEIRANLGEISPISARISPILPALGGTIGGVGWDLDPIPSSESNQPTNPAPVGRNPEEGKPAIDPVEQAHSAALLIAAGVMPANAKRLATAHPFERVQRAVAHWWCHKGVTFQETPGIVVTWLDDWPNTGLPPDLPTAFRRSDLYRRHRTRSQQAADAQVTVQLPQPVHHRQPPRTEDPLATLWATITATLPEGAQVYLRQASLLSVTNGRAQIAAPAAVVPWLRTQLSRRLPRDFALHGHEVQEVAIQEVGHASTP